MAWRKEELKIRLEKSEKLVSGEMPVEIKNTGEEGVHQIRAILGLGDLVTNVNMPNRGQIPNLPYDAVVETNVVFRADSVTPVMSGEMPTEILGLTMRIIAEQETVVDAGLKRDAKKAFAAFINDPLVVLNTDDARKLYGEMLRNTAKYLGEYDITRGDF